MFLWHEALPRRLSVAESERPPECSQCGYPAKRHSRLGLRALGEPVPAWRKQPVAPALPPLLSDYAAYRKAHNGTAETTVGRDLDKARRFLQHLRGRRRSLTRLGLQDIDTFVQEIAARVSTSTVADTCSSLRS